VTNAPPRIGVVIATRDRRASLLHTLGKLRALPERPPVVVVDNASHDGTAEAVHRTHPEVVVVPLERDAGSAARTVGVRALATDAVAFSDDDSWWAPGSLARASRLLDRHPSLGLVAAQILVGSACELDPTCGVMARTPLPSDSALPGPQVLGFVACGAVVRRSAYLAVGGFHPRLGFGGEESLLALDLAAAGWALAYVEGITAHHHPWRGGAGRELRRSIELRNRLWTTWLRRPTLPALAQTAAIAASTVRQRQSQALLQAARGFPWVLRERRRLPPEVECAARQLSVS
jgi:GT2 family glycosyltransferase